MCHAPGQTITEMTHRAYRTTCRCGQSRGTSLVGAAVRSASLRTTYRPLVEGPAQTRGGGSLMVAPIRIVVAKPGLDGHDRGAKVVARALRDAGNEVIYTGLHQTPEQIVETAIQEDADVIGLSVLSGAHMTLFKKLVELLEARDAGDIVVFGGGIIPEEDIPLLEQLGVAKVFTPGATTTEIVAWVRDNVADASGAAAS
jgi:methylmalonyl-CoA mutase C-terminal domain/subunit